MNAQKVFISHASEDKERFVESFARGLRNRRIDAWLDKWEMKPGDSLVQKIFDEGIRNADAFIVVLSKISITKRWVNEELNAAVVKRIEGGTKLIPIRLDECEVPESLRSTIWHSVTEADDPDRVASRIAEVIYGFESRPSLGETPRYLRNSISCFPRLNQIDSFILMLACENQLTNPRQAMRFRASSLLSSAIESGISTETFWESVEILTNQRYFQGQTFVRSNDGVFGVNTQAFDDYLNSKYPNYPEIEKNVAFALINEGSLSFENLTKRFDLPVPVLGHVLGKFEANGFIKGICFESGNWRITKICAALKRAFEN